MTTMTTVPSAPQFSTSQTSKYSNVKVRPHSLNSEEFRTVFTLEHLQQLGFQNDVVRDMILRVLQQAAIELEISLKLLNTCAPVTLWYQ
jgi:hypothetical protein